MEGRDGERGGCTRRGTKALSTAQNRSRPLLRPAKLSRPSLERYSACAGLRPLKPETPPTYHPKATAESREATQGVPTEAAERGLLPRELTGYFRCWCFGAGAIY